MLGFLAIKNIHSFNCRARRWSRIQTSRGARDGRLGAHTKSSRTEHTRVRCDSIYCASPTFLLRKINTDKTLKKCLPIAALFTSARGQLLPEAQSFLDRFEMITADPKAHPSVGPMNFIFEGNDGTGKGETARETATILSSRGFFDMEFPLQVRQSAAVFFCSTKKLSNPSSGPLKTHLPCPVFSFT